MIRHTFIILPHVGPRTEQRLWHNGIKAWDDFLEQEKVPGINEGRKLECDSLLRDADRFLELRRPDYFVSALPTVEQWRLFSYFKQDTAYLDIETDGLGGGAKVTVVGIHRPGRTVTLVRGQDLNPETLSKALEGVRMLVTYNGSSFDLPMINKEFPFIMPRVPHFDLRHGCARIGLTGGLKRLEERFGIVRPQEIAYVTGEQAAYLWKLWERQSKENALKLLVKYNREDTVNLEPLAAWVHEQLCTRVRNQIYQVGV